MATQINRDPFARATLMRERMSTKLCEWCGQPGRFAYYRQQDSIYPQRMGSTLRFCSVECWRAYNS